MSPEGKTAAAIAAELGVSRQAVYKRLKNDNRLSTELTRFTFTVHRTIYYTKEGEMLIKLAFANGGISQGVNRVNQSVNQDPENVNQNVNRVNQGVNQDPENVNQGVNRVNQDPENVNQNVNRVNQSVNQDDSDRAALIDSLHKRLDDKDRELEVLREQLRQKDAQITELQAQAARLTRALDNTVIALTAAQALHAADKQQFLTDSSEQPHKLSFWERLRVRRSRKNKE